MIQSIQMPSCERFEQLLLRAKEHELTEEEIAEYFSHIENCDIHSDSALERELNLPEGAFEVGSVAHGLLPARDRAERILRQIQPSPIQLAFRMAADMVPVANGSACAKARVDLGSTKQTLRTDDQSQCLMRAFEAAGIRHDGHIKFIRGCRVGTIFEFGRLRESNIWGSVLDACRSRLLPALIDERPDFIVGHTATMYDVARDLAEAMGTSRTHVLLALGDDRPFVVVPHNEVEGKTIAVLVDAVMSGSLLERLCKTIQSTLKARVVFVGCIVDIGYQGVYADRLFSLCTDIPDTYLDPCPRCASGAEALTFDHSAGVAIPCRPADEVNTEWRACFRDYAEWWDWIEQTGALTRNKALGGYIYEYFIDTRRLLDVAAVRAQILGRAADRLATLARHGDWVIAFRDLPRNTRSRLVATCLASLCGWDVSCVVFQKGRLFLPKAEAGKVRNRRVLIVDAAVNSGDCIRGVAQLVRDRGATHVGAFTLISRLPDDAARGHVNAVLDSPLESLFPFPFRAVRTSVAVQTKMRESLKAIQSDPVYREYYELIKRRGQFTRAASTRTSAQRLSTIQSLWQSLATGEPEDVFASTVDQRELHALLRALPKNWGQYPHVRQALCAIARNGVAVPTLERVVVDLTAIGCFEWLPHGWLTDHLQVLKAKSWGFVPLCMREAVATDPALRVPLRREILSLLEPHSGIARQANLFSEDANASGTAERSAIRTHLEYLLGVVDGK